MIKEQQNNTSGIQDMPQAREQDLLKDPRIKTLIDDFGMAGFGAYCLLRKRMHKTAYQWSISFASEENTFHSKESSQS